MLNASDQSSESVIQEHSPNGWRRMVDTSLEGVALVTKWRCISEVSGLWRTFGEGELKRTEKRRASPIGVGAVIRRSPKVPEITNRLAAPVEIEQYHQMCARTAKWRMHKRRICSYDMVEVPAKSYLLEEEQGEMYFCNARWRLPLVELLASRIGEGQIGLALLLLAT